MLLKLWRRGRTGTLWGCQRLQSALDKLQAPGTIGNTMGSLEGWWEAMQIRNLAHDIEFVAKLHKDKEIPLEGFDSIVENLLENARFKRQIETGLSIEVTLSSDDEGIQLRVSDDGSAIPPNLAESLFSAPLDSQSGLGVGLYQAAQQAEQMGFALTLCSNETGSVCFKLSNI